jgi:hypothetical protein
MSYASSEARAIVPWLARAGAPISIREHTLRRGRLAFER